MRYFYLAFAVLPIFILVLIPARVQITLNSAEAEMSSSVLPAPETFKAFVTAYSELDSCHHPGCIMANGVKADIGYVACPRNLSFGTQVRIYGEIYTCADRTAKRYDGRFDIFMGYGKSSHEDALKFGIVQTEIEILK